MTRLLLLLLALPTLALAADAKKSKANEEYPLKTCVVSDEPLPADFVAYTHREPGKPDRVVRLCCEGCIEDFRINPEKFLKKLDAAKTKKG